MCIVDKIKELVKTGQCSTATMYLALVKQTPAEFLQMRDDLQALNITFTTGQRKVEDKVQHDLYLVTGNGESMALVAQNCTVEWLEQRGFSLV